MGCIMAYSTTGHLIVHAYRTLGANVFRPEDAVKHHFVASLCDNSNIKPTLFNLKVLKPFICSLSFKLHTHCEETIATFLSFQSTLSIFAGICVLLQIFTKCVFFIFTT